MLSKFVLAMTLFLASFSTLADTASHRALAEDVLEITRASAVLDGMTNHMRSMFAQAVRGMNVPEQKKAVVDEYGKRLSDLLAEEMNWSKLKGQFVDVYTKVFTEAELKELLEFYESPLGQKMISKMPELMQESMQIGQQQMRQLTPKVQALMQEMVADMKADQPAQP